MAQIIKKLNLNKVPQTVDNNSFIFAKNIKLDSQGINILRDDGLVLIDYLPDELKSGNNTKQEITARYDKLIAEANDKFNKDTESFRNTSENYKKYIASDASIADLDKEIAIYDVRINTYSKNVDYKNYPDYVTFSNELASYEQEYDRINTTSDEELIEEFGSFQAVSKKLRELQSLIDEFKIHVENAKNEYKTALLNYPPCKDWNEARELLISDKIKLESDKDHYLELYNSEIAGFKIQLDKEVKALKAQRDKELSAVQEIGGEDDSNKYYCVKGVATTTEIIMFMCLKNIKTGVYDSSKSYICRYSEKTQKTTLVESAWTYHGGVLNCCYVYNAKDELIISIGESNASEDIPLKIINLSTCKWSDDESAYTPCPKVPLCNMRLVSKVNSDSIPCGVYTFFIRYEVLKDNYSQWFPIGVPYYALNESYETLIDHVFETHDGTAPANQTSNNTEIDLKGVAAEYLGYKVNKDTYCPYSFNFQLTFNKHYNHIDKYQIGYILQSNETQYGRIWKTLDINKSNVVELGADHFIFDANYTEEISVDEFNRVKYNLFNVKNVVNYFNSTHISNYKETQFNVDLKRYANKIKVRHYKKEYTGNTTVKPTVIPDNSGFGTNIYYDANITYGSETKKVRFKLFKDGRYYITYKELGKIFPSLYDDKTYGKDYLTSFKEGLTPGGHVRLDSYYQPITGPFDYENQVLLYHVEDVSFNIFSELNRIRNSKYSIYTAFANTGQAGIDTRHWENCYGVDDFINGEACIDYNIPKSPEDIKLNEYDPFSGTELNIYLAKDTSNRLVLQFYDKKPIESFGVYCVSFVGGNRMATHITNIDLSMTVSAIDSSTGEDSSSGSSGISDVIQLNNTFIPNQVYNFFVHYVREDGTYTNGIQLQNDNVDNNLNKKLKDLSNPNYSTLSDYVKSFPAYCLFNNADSSKFGYYKDIYGNSLFRAPDVSAASYIIGCTFSDVEIPNGYVGCFFSYEKVEFNVMFMGRTLSKSIGLSADGKQGFAYKCFELENPIIDSEGNVARTIMPECTVYKFINDAHYYERLYSKVYVANINATNKNIRESYIDGPIAYDGTIGTNGEVVTLSTRSSAVNNEYLFGINVTDTLYSNKVKTLIPFTGMIWANGDADEESSRSNFYYPEYLCKEHAFTSNPIYVDTTGKVQLIMNVPNDLTAEQNETIKVANKDIIELSKSIQTSYADIEHSSVVEMLKNKHIYILDYEYVKYSHFNLDAISIKPKIIQEVVSALNYGYTKQSGGNYDITKTPLKNRSYFNKILPPQYMSEVFELKHHYLVKNFYYYTNFKEGDLNHELEEYNNTIRRSNVLADENLGDSLKCFEAESYKMIPEYKGSITKLLCIGTNLFIHCEHSLFMFDKSAKLKRSYNSNINLSQTDIFEQDAQEIFTAENGFGGLQDPKAVLVNEYGYTFYDNDGKAIYNIDGGDIKLNIISQSISNIIKSKEVKNVRFANDRNNYRMFCRIEFVDTDVMTLSYNYLGKAFFSLHDFNFSHAYFTKNNCYLSDDKNLGFYRVEQSATTYNVLTMIDNLYPYINEDEADHQDLYRRSCIIDIMCNEGYETIKKLNSISWIVAERLKSSYSDLLAEEQLDRSYKGNSLKIYSDSCETEYLDISSRANNHKIDTENHYIYPWYDRGIWNFNAFKDIRRNDIFGYQADNVSDMYGKYFVVRLVFNNGIDFKLENLHFNISY